MFNINFIKWSWKFIKSHTFRENNSEMLDKYQHSYFLKISQAGYFIYRMSKKQVWLIRLQIVHKIMMLDFWESNSHIFDYN